MKNKLIINYEVKDDGRLYLDLGSLSGQHLDYSEILSVLVSSLSMSIRIAGESSHKTEGQIFREVLSHLEKEFINPDSFKDLEVLR